VDKLPTRLLQGVVDLIVFAIVLRDVSSERSNDDHREDALRAGENEVGQPTRGKLTQPGKKQPTRNRRSGCFSAAANRCLTLLVEKL